MKISIHSGEFIKPIAHALSEGKELVIFHQFAWAGGYQEWFLIQQLEQLDKVLGGGKAASAFTAYEWIDVPLPRFVEEEWLTQTLDALARETHNQMLLINLLTPHGNDSFQLVWIGEPFDLNEFYKEHIGIRVRVGRIPSVWTGEIVRGYYPDANGVPQSGPY